MKFILKVFLLISFFSSVSLAKTVRYELNIENKKVNVTGTEVDFALTVNGGIPAPTLEFTEGDQAEIVVNNKLSNQETSLHWHGILLPPEEDGVAYVNTPPIRPGQSRTFKFTIRQHGTYWYHSHTMLQEQKGVYGAIVIHPKKPSIRADKNIVLVLSDWSNENADQIIKNLKKDGDYYLYKKNSLRSIGGALAAGEFKTYLTNQWDRMGGMDLSDIGYDAFLINGKKEFQVIDVRPNEVIRLRIINAASSSYFNVALAKTPMQIIAADGVDVTPFFAKEILMGMAETYDVLLTVPEDKSYELRATAQDQTGYASAWLGRGEKVKVIDKTPINLYAPMNHNEHGGTHHTAHLAGEVPEAGDHANMDHSMMGHLMPMSIVDVANVDELRALKATSLPKKAPVYELKLVLGGDMQRYVWHINGQVINQDRLININEGDIVRFTFENQTMMHHPMHLHGHFFRVINKNQEFSPLKHTVDVPPMGTRTIEFYANEPGQWMLHCHNLYHMDTGMARVVRYNSYKPTPEQHHLDQQDHHRHDPWYQSSSLLAATNILEGRAKISQSWNEIELRAEGRKENETWNGEGDLFYHRWVDNNLNFILGGASVKDDYRGQAGVGYLLPMLIESKFLVDQKGKLRINLEKRFQWTQNLFTEAEYTYRQDPVLDSEYLVSLMYSNNWHWSAGVKYTGHAVGAGFQYKF